jgi:hypothetical protein
MTAHALPKNNRESYDPRRRLGARGAGGLLWPNDSRSHIYFAENAITRAGNCWLDDRRRPGVAEGTIAVNSVMHNTQWVPGHFHTFYCLA